MIRTSDRRASKSWSDGRFVPGVVSKRRLSIARVLQDRPPPIAKIEWIDDGTDVEPEVEDTWRLAYEFSITSKHRAYLSQIYNPPIIRRSEKQLPKYVIQARLDDLRQNAIDEGLTISSESEAAFWSFINEFQISEQPKITARLNGNIRALWQNEAKQIGLQFMGGLSVGYVLFSDFNDPDNSQHYGIAEFHALADVITALGLRDLWY